MQPPRRPAPSRPVVPTLAALGVALAGLAVAGTAPADAATVRQAYGNGPFVSSDCSKYASIDPTAKLRNCVRHSGSTVTSGFQYTVNLPVMGGPGITWSLIGRPFRTGPAGSTTKTYEKHRTQGLLTKGRRGGQTVTVWLTRGGIASTICVQTRSDGASDSPVRNGSGNGLNC